MKKKSPIWENMLFFLVPSIEESQIQVIWESLFCRKKWHGLRDDKDMYTAPGESSHRQIVIISDLWGCQSPLPLGGSISISKQLGSPPCISQKKGPLEGVPQPYLGDLLTMVIKHLLTGMILQGG